MKRINIIALLVFCLTLAFAISLYFYKPTIIYPPIFAMFTELIVYIGAMRKFSPKVEVYENEDEVVRFIENFASRGSSVVIVSNRLSWIDDDFISKVREMKEKGVKFEVIMSSQDARKPIIEKLQKVIGISSLMTDDKYTSRARFTLINSGRAGSEQLAIAKGTYPEHEITVFDSYSGPQIIAMAEDIVREAKAHHAP